MTNPQPKSILIHHSIPKIILSLIKPFSVFILSCILLLPQNLENTYHELVITSIGFIIIAVSCYCFFQAVRVIVQNKNNYLLIDSNGLYLRSTLSRHFHIKWHNIQLMHSIVQFDKFILETNLTMPIGKVSKYEIMYPIKSPSKNTSHCSIVVSAKYLNIHVKELERILQNNIPSSTHTEN